MTENQKYENVFWHINSTDKKMEQIYNKYRKSV